MSLPFQVIFIVLKSRRFKWERQRPKNPPVFIMGRKQPKPKKPLHYLMLLFFCKYLAALGLNCGTQDFLWAVQDLSSRCTDSLVVAHRLSCSATCGILVPDQGSYPHHCSTRWTLDHWTTREVPDVSYFSYSRKQNALETEMATHSSILAWEIPWTEELGGLQSTGWQKSWTQLSNWTTTVFYTSECQKSGISIFVQQCCKKTAFSCVYAGHAKWDNRRVKQFDNIY